MSCTDVVKNCQVLEKEAFQKQMLEKLIWICSFMLVGARNGGVTVGAVEKEFTSDVSFALDSFYKTLLSLSINHLRMHLFYILCHG